MTFHDRQEETRNEGASGVYIRFWAEGNKIADGQSAIASFAFRLKTESSPTSISSALAGEQKNFALNFTLT